MKSTASFRQFAPCLTLALACLFPAISFPQIAGKSTATDLLLADASGTKAVIVVSPMAGKWERQAATDLAKYLEAMTGAKPALADKPTAIVAALKGSAPALLIGSEALDAEPSLRDALAKVAAKNPILRADAIVVRRKGNRVLIAGSNDEAHYYAVAHLLQLWGCRWYFPGDFGECIPHHAALKMGEIDFAYAPPFEVRNFWLAWNAHQVGAPEFQRRNFGNSLHVPNGHALAHYTKDLVPKGKTVYNVPIAEDTTAEHVARLISTNFSKGLNISLGLEDGLYESDSPKDGELKSGFMDKYFLTPSMTDAFLTFYNNVSRILIKQFPESPSRIGFLAYANITLPPQRNLVAEKPLVAYLAPIDIDPNHGMDDPRSPPRQEYREMLYRWSKVMQGRVVIYDYDQGMLVWRDLPNPALTALRQDIHHYRVADTLYHLGTVAWSNGRNDLAITHHQQAVDICERLALTDLVAVQAFHGRGEAHFASAEPAQAIVCFLRSLGLARCIGDKSYESENLMMIGWACTGHMGLADYPRALLSFDAALVIARTADLQWHLGPTLIGRAHVWLALGKFGQAWADLNEALPCLETLRLVRYQMMAHDALGCLFLDLNLPGQASEHFERGLQLACDAAIKYWVPRLQANLAVAQLRLGVPCDLSRLQEALQYSQDYREGWLASRCMEALAESALADGDAQGCISHADQLLALASRGGMRALIGQAHGLRGRALLAVNSYQAARKELTQAVRLAKQLGRVRLAWECHRALAQVATALNDRGDESDQRASVCALAAQIAENLRGSGLMSHWEADQ